MGNTYIGEPSPIFKKWCQENYPKTYPSYTTLYYSDGTSSAFNVSTITWSDVGKSAYFETNESVIRVVGGTNCTSIGSNAFWNCSNLSDVSFRSCVTIGSGAFTACQSLEVASFPMCTTIESGAFDNCKNLSDVSFPSCTTIGSWAFDNCQNLTNVSFPSCKTIEHNAFRCCISLSMINIPDTVTSIGYGAFFNPGYSMSIYTTSQNVANLFSNQNFAGIMTPQGTTIAYVYLNGTLFSTFFVKAECFVKGTKITMADGTKKNIEDLNYGDNLKVWDFDEGKEGTSPICWITEAGFKNDHYYKLTFSDGTVLKTTGQNSNHKVYNVDERYFKGVNITEVGDRIMSENGIVTVTDKEYVEEEIEYYNLITQHKINCYAEGILTSDRYGNMYQIDENMKYVKDGREIRPYSLFEEVGIERFWYDDLRLGEINETVEDTVKYIQKLRGQMRPRS